MRLYLLLEAYFGKTVCVAANQLHDNGHYSNVLDYTHRNG